MMVLPTLSFLECLVVCGETFSLQKENVLTERHDKIFSLHFTQVGVEERP